MTQVPRRRPWQLRDNELTDEKDWLHRRQIIRALGLGSIAAGVGILPGCGADATGTQGPLQERYAHEVGPAHRNAAYTLDRPLTEEVVAASYNNFYEFSTDKAEVWRIAHTLEPRPWAVEVTGACQRPGTFDMDDLIRTMPLEERTYRFRCVEAWSMAVPWIGFPIKALLDRVEPTGSAKYVRMVTRDAPRMFPGVVRQSWYPWPYHEGLTMAEAMNELALFAVGIYGHALPNQHGAPIRLVVPWKYGYKNIKSIAKIELVEERPPTFWNEEVPEEYDFLGNVRPDIPHARWSQATERVIPSGERIPTLMYNGYADQVAALYG
ncbi:MAG: protein-methionine-sulfoxide reductase catalytic subunit MsrP [Deltaproteobacteria bacterium]|nr:protein-methionine-sulfoxide reductase catalytic subunit MsrP [Deltaproteobacteria bacterium]